MCRFLISIIFIFNALMLQCVNAILLYCVNAKWIISCFLTKKKNFCLSCNTFSKDALFIDDEIRKKTSFPLVKRDILDNSIKILEKDYSKDSQDLIALFNLALAYLNTGRHEDSIKLWKEFIKLSPKKYTKLSKS